jgi:hypothetical protein
MRAACVWVVVLVGCGARSQLAGDVAPSDAGREPLADSGEPATLCGIAADSGGGPCGQPEPQGGLTCCGAALVNLENDPLNCGACGHRCAADEMCLGYCLPPRCATACGACQVCCAVTTAGPSSPPFCVDGPTCPVGCPYCT